MANFTPVGVEAEVKGFGAFIGNLGKMDSAIQATGKSSGSVGSQFTSLGSSVLGFGAIAAGVAAGGIAALGAGLAAITVSSVKMASSLDQQMADIAAVMGKTKDEVAPLKNEILSLSIDPQLRVNATQAAQAIELLARNGLSMTAILDGAAKSTVALANATGADFGVAADVATDVMAIFGLQADQMGLAIDGITGVTTNSKLTIDDYALALASVGAVGQGMGMSLEDMNTTLAATASSFSSGRVAGTSLKTMFQRLGSPTEEMTAAMDKYGISLFDSEGNMRSMSNVTGQLNRAFSGLTDAEAANLATTLGGADGARQIIALSKMSSQEFENLSAKVNANGQAMKAAATRVDSLQGAMDIFKSIIQSVQIQIGDKFLPILKDLVIMFTNISARYGPQVVGFFGSIADKISSNAIPAIRKIVSTIGNLIELFKVGGVEALLFGGMLGEIGWGGIQAEGLLDSLGLTPETAELIDKIMGSITELGTSIMAYLLPGMQQLSGGGILDAINTAIIFLNQNFEAFKGAIIGIGAVLAGAAIAALISGIAAAIATLFTPITAIIAIAALLGAAWATNWFNIQGITQSAWEVLSGIFNAIVNVFNSVILPQLNAAFSSLTTSLGSMGITWGSVWNALVEATKIVGLAIGVVILGIITVITGLVSGFSSAFATAVTYVNAFVLAFSTIIAGITLSIQGTIAFIQSIIAGDWAGAWAAFVQIFQGNVTVIEGLINLIVTFFTAGFNTITSFISGFVSGITGMFNELYSTLVGNSIVPDMIQGIITSFTSMVQPIVDTVSGMVSTVTGLFSQLFGGGEGGGMTFDLSALKELPGVIADNIGKVGEMTSALSSLVAALGNPIMTAIKKFQKEMTGGFFIVQTALDLIVTTINLMISDIFPGLVNITQNATQEMSKLFSAVFSTSSALSNINSALSGFSSSVNSAIGAIGDIIGELQDLSDNALDASRAFGNFTSVKSKLDQVRDSINQINEALKQMVIDAASAASALNNVGGSASSTSSFSTSSLMTSSASVSNITNQNFNITLGAGSAGISEAQSALMMRQAIQQQFSGL